MEIELKLLVTEEQAAALPKALARLGLHAGAATRHQMTAKYFDTEDGALRAAGTTLRVRREGKTWIQAVKAGRDMTFGLSRVAESEIAVKGGKPDLAAIARPELRAAVGELVDGRPLKVVGELRTKRMTWSVAVNPSDIVEIALDRCEIVGGTAPARFIEVELERKQGRAEALFSLARMLFPSGGLRLSQIPKSERALRHAAGEPIEIPLKPRKSASIDLPADASAERYLRAAIGECADQIARNAEVAVEGDMSPEAIHQLRVGLRRLRSLFAVSREMMDGPELKALDRTAKALGVDAGRVRDLDVTAQLLESRRKQAGKDRVALDTVIAALKAEAAARRPVLQARLRDAEMTQFLFDLMAMSASDRWQMVAELGRTRRPPKPAAGFAKAAIDSALTHAGKRFDEARLKDPLSRHEFRKALKSFRYVVGLLSPAVPGDGYGRVAKPLEKLQDALGALQDVVALEEVLLAEGESAVANLPRDPAAQRAIGRILGAEDAFAKKRWNAVKALWRKLLRKLP